MRVLINGLAALKRKTGIGHYTGELLRCLRAQAGEAVIEIFPGRWLSTVHSLGRRARSWLPQGSGAGGPSGGGWQGPARYLARTLLEADFHARRRLTSADLYHEPNHIPMATDLPTVATVHDLSVVLYPELHPSYRAAEYEMRFRRGLAQTRHFLAVSEFTRQELIQKLGLPPDRVTRTYNGVRPGLGPMAAADVQVALRPLGLPPRYFLYLGTIEPRKNVMTLLRAYVSLPDNVRERYPLLLVGGWGWNSADVASYLDGEARHRGVVYTGYLPEKSLAIVLNGARALVYPSLYEGFGLPPVEMMACGGAVICSTAGALVETVGARAHLVAPSDEDGWREALRRAAADDDWIAELRRGATEVVRPYTWERCAAETLAVYRAVCGRTESGDRNLRRAG